MFQLNKNKNVIKYYKFNLIIYNVINVNKNLLNKIMMNIMNYIQNVIIVIVIYVTNVIKIMIILKNVKFVTNRMNILMMKFKK